MHHFSNVTVNTHGYILIRFTSKENWYKYSNHYLSVIIVRLAITCQLTNTRNLQTE